MKRTTWLLVGMLLCYFRVAHAQEPRSDQPAGVQAGTSGRLAAPIDFWGRGIPAEKPRSEILEVGPGKIKIRETVWAQPIQTPDGSWMLYVPPKPVLDFLENPTEGTAKAYLAWKSDQADKIARAMALLGRVKAANANLPKPDPGPGEGRSDADLGTGSVTLVYFKKPSCPHCISQDQVLAQWLPKHPSVRVDPVLPNERPELWKSYGIRGTPTLIVRSEAGKEGVLVGLQSEAQLEAALGRLAQRSPEAPEREEKERSR